MALSFFTGKKNKEKGFKKILRPIWGKCSQRLGKNPRGRDGKFTSFICCYLSFVPSPVLGALKECEKRESHCVVELRYHEREADQMVSLYYSYLVFVRTFNFPKHAHIQVQITCL